jgi:hypothetical protein
LPENYIHGHINDFLVRTGLPSGVSELQLPMYYSIADSEREALMSGSALPLPPPRQ